MHSKTKWLGIWVIVALMLVSMVAAVNAAPNLSPDVVDNDQDGLTAAQELTLGTSDTKPDSDGDGICDGAYLGGLNAGCATTWGVNGGPDGLPNSGDDPINVSPVFGGEDQNLNGVVDAGETNPAKADTDGDLMDDDWEWLYSNSGTTVIAFWPTIPPTQPARCGATNPLVADAGNDNDPANPLIAVGNGDNLSNLEEYQLGTNPCNADTDQDLKLDGNEVKGIGGFTNPLNPDTDGDGLCDSVENKGGTFLQPHALGLTPPPPALPYPINAAALVGLGTAAMFPNPGACMIQWSSGYYAGSDPTLKDTDGDGVWDGVEASGSSNAWNILANLGNPTGPRGHISDPNKKDTDGDGVEDGAELNFVGGGGLNMDPSQTDTDKDGMPDKYEFDRQNCGFGKLDPTVFDPANDVDGDGLSNIIEYNGVDKVNGTPDDGMFSDACKVDTDGDGMNDGFEYFYSVANAAWGVLDPTKDDAALDPDKDAASNYTEYMGLGKTEPMKDAGGKFLYPPTGDNTDPTNPNSDNPTADPTRDPYLDGFEYWANWDPAQTACPAAATPGSTRMDPLWTNDAALSVATPDYDGDTLTNVAEYAGTDTFAPVPADVVALFPGDLKGTTWTAGDPYYRFQPSGKGADATNPCNADTDRGGYSDGVEVTILGLNPNFKTDDKTADHDFDGIPTYTEDADHDGVYDSPGETNWSDPDTDKDGLCDGKIQATDGLLNGGEKVALGGAYGSHRILIKGGAWYSDFNDNQIYFPADAADKFICGGGEDLNGDGKIGGDTNNDHSWQPLGANGIWENGAGDDEVWTETDPRNADTDLDGLCDGNPQGLFGTSTCAGKPEDANNNGVWDEAAGETNPLDADSDDDQLGDGLEKSSSCLSAVNPDTDGDTLWDGFKAIQQYVNPTTGDGIQLGNGFGFAVWQGYDGADHILGNADDQPGEDISRNGVVDLDETNPCAADSDKDGVKDGIEYTYYESPLHKTTAPWNTLNALTLATDIDTDGLRPALDPDSDGDSLCDGDVKNPANTGCNTITQQGASAQAIGAASAINQIIGEDLNGDGLSPAPETNPMNPDTDGDKVWDGVEVTWFETFNCSTWKYEDWTVAGFDLTKTWDCDKDGNRDALDIDSDSDALTDGKEDSDVNGRIAGDDNIGWDRVMQPAETWLETDPLSWDTDHDGVNDGAEVNSPVLGCFNPVDADSDNDGLLDGQEDLNGDGVLAGDTGIGAPSNFGKNDGVIQFNEVWTDTSPCNEDTDVDGIPDYVEVWGWEQGNLITTDGWPGLNAPKPMNDNVLDKDGRRDATDPDSDGDGICDGNESNQEMGFSPSQWQQVSNNPALPWEKNWKKVCDLIEVATTTTPSWPWEYLREWRGEDDGDGVIGYGRFFTSLTPFYYYYGSGWVPVKGFDSFDIAFDDLPVEWQTYFNHAWGEGQDRYQWDYPWSWMPVTVNPTFGTGDWDRDRVIDAPYTVPGWNAVLYTLVEDWGETDPLNADSDRDGIPDMAEANAEYAGWNQNRNGFCNGANLWGPVTADLDGDGVKDGAEDVDHDGIYFDEASLINDKPTMGGTGTSPIASPNSTGIETDPCGKDSDGDGLSDGQEVNTVGTSPADTDSDNDGWTDGQEVLGQVPGPGGKQSCNPMSDDTDGDKLLDGEEGAAGVDGYITSCNDKDTDHGGVSDYDEYWILRVKGGVSGDPLVPADDTADTDGDGLSNYAELTDTVNTCLDPKKADSDGDALKDGDELSGVKNVLYGKQPTNPCRLDTDGDLISDYDEITYTGTNPNNPDTDGDGLKDNEELFAYHTDPTKADTDGDGLSDSQEVNTTHTDPNKADTDGDGISDGDEVNTYHTDPLKADTDGDDMPDGYEVQYDCLNPLVADANADPDGDGYTNIEEMRMGTNPCVYNCDLPYDFVPDREITVADVLVMTPHWGETPASADWVAAYDVDGDKLITVIDFMVVVNHIGEKCQQP